MIVLEDAASGTDRHLDITFRFQVVESSSLVSVLFREAFSHPYISFFHLLGNAFCVSYNYHNPHHQFLLTVFSEYTEVNAISLIPLDTILPEKCAYIMTLVLAVQCGLN